MVISYTCDLHLDLQISSPMNIDNKPNGEKNHLSLYNALE